MGSGMYAALLVFLVWTSRVTRTRASCLGKSGICINGSTVVWDYQGVKFPILKRKFNVTYSEINQLEIHAANIEEIDPAELGKMANLHELYITGCKNLKKIPPMAFSNNPQLYVISIVNCSIDEISSQAFEGAFKSYSLNGELRLDGNKLRVFPKFSSDVPGLKMLSLDRNEIRTLDRLSLRNLPKLHTLYMRYTSLRSIGEGTFNGKGEVAKFDASGSKDLEHINKHAFQGASKLVYLMLNDTKISEVPSIGLRNLVELHLHGVLSINSVSDDVINLPKLKSVYVAEERRFLCCAFLHKRSETLRSEEVQVNHTKDCTTRVLSTTAARTTASTTTSSSVSTRLPSGSTTKSPWGFSGRRRALLWFGDWVPSNKNSTDLVKTSHPYHTDPNWGTRSVEPRTAIFECGNQTNATFLGARLEPVACYPEPDALRPCIDIMGNTYLTTLSFVVSFVAVISNGAVFSILIMSKRQFSVTKYLIINLAFADLCLSLYLFVLTCASIDTSGKYYNSVFSWQYEGGCDIVGFLAVFSSELSMLILTVITIERYLAIVYAVYLQKRLSFRQATVLTSASWFIAVLIALLPLTGINSYKEVAICLPFRISTSSDVAYLGFVFGFNTLLFVVILGCYGKIYWEVAGPRSSGRPPDQGNDSSIAKRIALLVFTDFACWLPIAIIGIISAAGRSESINMTVEKSKYLLVIFFPINSLCNPFLYALSTRTFRREFLNVLVQCGFCHDRFHKYHTNTYTGQSGNRKLNLTNRRATETINLTTLTSLNGSSTVKVGTPVLLSTRNEEPALNRRQNGDQALSLTQDLLVVPASSVLDNNNARAGQGSRNGSNMGERSVSSLTITEEIGDNSNTCTGTVSTIPVIITFDEKSVGDFDAAMETRIAF